MTLKRFGKLPNQSTKLYPLQDQQNYGLQSLLEEYPELASGFSEFFVEEEGAEAVALIGVMTLLKLRLRSVVQLLPGARSDADGSMGNAAGS